MYSYIHMGCEHSVKARARGRLDKRMLALATDGLYAHDGEWLKLSRDYFLFCNHGPSETRE